MGIVTICGTTVLAGLLRDFMVEQRWAIEKDYNRDYIEQNV
jgi:hypothetical protein